MPAFSVADELIKFKGLLDAGVLTQEELDAQKRKLLDMQARPEGRDMRFAYLIMGAGYDQEADRAQIAGGKARIIGVPDLDAACDVARELAAEGVDVIEVCGAFEERGARALAEATGGKVLIGYITHLDEQAELHRSLFG